jgi:hypothetical protein
MTTSTNKKELLKQVQRNFTPKLRKKRQKTGCESRPEKENIKHGLLEVGTLLHNFLLFQRTPRDISMSKKIV